MSKTIPNQLKGKVWHSTSVVNAKKIVTHGEILANPDIEAESRWGGTCESKYPFVRTLGGISLFDFRLPKTHSNELLTRWVPCHTKIPATVWFEIDISKLKGFFLSAEETRIKWRDAGMDRQFMPHLEASCLCPISVQDIKSIYIGYTSGKFTSVSLNYFLN